MPAKNAWLSRILGIPGKTPTEKGFRRILKAHIFIKTIISGRTVDRDSKEAHTILAAAAQHKNF
ncbi:MAG: hypothetical protein CMH27_07690 [Micavibrio sp.]|nr:hypothetical protein [Micavibrio sp.]|tara:strand:- start:231 stop:422 length:192 start_codon:yes stop_codon:yes gene_type:complete